MNEIVGFATVLSPVILGLVELIKVSTTFKKNLIPIVALFIGLGIGAASGTFTDLDLEMRIWAGGIAGLSSTGLYELGGKVMNIIRKEEKQ